MLNSLFLCCILSILSLVFCDTCKNPQVTSKFFTTQDATIVTNIAYISEFTVSCLSGKIDNLYAELEGNIVPISMVGPNKYQVSWTEDIKSAKGGNRIIRIFDEEGFTSFRKIQRSGEDISSVSSVFNIVINHPGAYSGPWLKSELFATIVSIIVAYFAISFKSKVTA